MSGPSFSVVVCTDGRLPYLKSTVRALRSVEYAPFELVLVGGPTPDGTRGFLETLRGEAKLAFCGERNLSRARNIGLSLAGGEIVAFLDDDAIPEPEWLADLAGAYGEADVAAAGGVVYDPNGLDFQARFVTLDRLGYAHAQRAPTPHWNYPFSAEFPHLLGANCSFRRDALVSVGGFDEEYEYFLDESDVLARINDAGGRIVQSPRAAVHHRFAANVDRDARRVVRHWRPLIKNRLYFGLRNGLGHHPALAPLRAALEDAEQWRGVVVGAVARGDLDEADLARFESEALDGVEAGLAAARLPRKLMAGAPAPAPLQPFPTWRPQGGKLGLCLVSQDYPPGHNGGIARNTAELAAAWARLGHDVHVFTRARGRPSLDFEDGVWVHRAAVTPAGPPPDLGLDQRVPQAIWDASRTMSDKVEALASRRRVDYVYAPLWDCEPVAFLAEPRFPLVCALQTTLDFWLDSAPERRLDADWMRERGAPVLALERWCLTHAPYLHANSRAIVDDISTRYRLSFATERLIYSPHGLTDVDVVDRRCKARSDLAIHSPPLDRLGFDQGAAGRPRFARNDERKGAVRFLFVGRLESRKGIDVLLAVAPAVLRRLPEARLDVVGDDTIPSAQGATYREIFARRVDVADVAHRIVFHGRVEDDELCERYRVCDVVVTPSRYESFGLVYVEGMMFGKPVIAGRAGGGGEVVEAGVCGLLVAPGDAVALEAAMLRLGEDADLRREMGLAGRRRYEARFTADATGNSLLTQIMAKTPR